ncbi:unnamed protein product [Adineta ricciae]|uniref:Uncharacterized protein n=1 Tax=Adineta ricciae TaxID=249248 RepID=A0A815NQ25_ADIRI|nr:unnamed protein product [Adineta ricciae]CAF1437514.1 unnamed protein product [Adineta ricciae]
MVDPRLMIYFLFIVVNDGFNLSYNEPNLSACPSWNPRAITLVNSFSPHFTPMNVHVNRKNTVFATDYSKHRILMWLENSTDPQIFSSEEMFLPNSIFVSSNDLIYISNEEDGHVIEYSLETGTTQSIITFTSTCDGLFIDIEENLYCSLSFGNLVKKRALKSVGIEPINVAGNGTSGDASNLLFFPQGIFVDTNFDVYVADCGNNRIQLFRSNQPTGITLVGRRPSIYQISLYCPAGIVLDADKRPYIVDRHNHRIVGPGPSGLRCLIGCDERSTLSFELSQPRSLSFNGYGDIFIADTYNNGIQKFILSKTPCDLIPFLFTTSVTVTLSETSQRFSRMCDTDNQYYYETFQVTVNVSGNYVVRRFGMDSLYASFYTNTFNPLKPLENRSEEIFELLPAHREIPVFLEMNRIYILVVTTRDPANTGTFAFEVSGPINAIIGHIENPLIIQLQFSSQFTSNSSTFSRDCRQPNYYYEAFEIEVTTAGSYILWSVGTMETFGYIYEKQFDPLKPFEHLLLQHSGDCNDGQFKLITNLQTNRKYILVATTYDLNVKGNFSVIVAGPQNISFNLYKVQHPSCVLGQGCRSTIKSIGITLDDILQDQVREGTVLTDQPLSVQLSAALTMIMLVGGLINGACSLFTFINKDLRQTGCGIYLFASSITSLLTVGIFTLKFWFLIVSQTKILINVSVLRAGCVFIECFLKVLIHLDSWFNAYVAVERAILVFKGVHFDKKTSQRWAYWLVFLSPFCILSTFIHEPLHRKLFEYQPEIKKEYLNETVDNVTRIVEYTNETKQSDVWCVTSYSPSVQTYNTIIQFIHLLGPFTLNLFSSLFIIFGVARQRSNAQTRQTYFEHVREQFHEHKRLLISSVTLMILALPRLILALLPGCLNVSDHLWLYLFGYFVSFTPSILIFIVFVVPSKSYLNTFKKTLKTCSRKHLIL